MNNSIMPTKLFRIGMWVMTIQKDASNSYIITSSQMLCKKTEYEFKEEVIPCGGSHSIPEE